MSDKRQLLFVWKDPSSRLRYVIGHLSFDGANYTFAYERSGKYDLEDALEVGFLPPAAFPTSQGQFTSSELFPIFRRRLPPKWREQEYKLLGLTTEQKFDYLRLTGGRLQGDTFELLEPLQRTEDSYEIEFPVAGWQHYDGEQAVSQLAPGVSLRLELDEQNLYDSSAIKIYALSDILLGYVPRVYSWHIDKSVQDGLYRAEVARIGNPDDPQNRVTVSLKGQLPSVCYRAVPTGLELLTR